MNMIGTSVRGSKRGATKACPNEVRSLRSPLPSTAWLTKDAVVGLMDHAVRMSSGKAGVKKAKKANSSMSNNDDDEFDPFNPHANLRVNGGPIPFSRHHKLRQRKVKEVQKGPLMEESMATWAEDKEDEDNLDYDAYGDGAERPKKVKQMSDKRKRALLTRGQSNPADQMRAELEYKANMENYKKAKGIVTEDTIDHTKVAQYGQVDARRKKHVDGEDDVKEVTDEDLQRIQDELDRKREEELRAVAEKELMQKEKQLVSRRLGHLELDRKKGLILRIGR